MSIRPEIRNERLARTGFSDERGAYYALDNAGIIMPSVTNDIATNLFRLEATLAAPVDAERMDRALARVALRFRYFNVQLRRGFFWYYFEPCGGGLRAVDDSGFPCQGYNITRPGTRMFRVRVGGRRIAGEFSHALTDGSGAISFMKSLLAEYFRMGGIAPGAEIEQGTYGDIRSCDSPPSQEEYEDGYRKHFSSKLPHAKADEKAWHLPQPLVERGRYRVTGAELSLGEALAAAKSRGVSLTEFLAAVYMDSLQDLWFADLSPGKRHLISLEIPVNMRKFFPSRTNRNFSLFVLVTQDMRLGRRGFQEILERTHHQLRIAHDPKSISMQITRNVAGAISPAVRAVPLAIKDIFARILFNVFGDNTLSGFLSNLGRIELPPGMEPHVSHWNFIPAPSTLTKTNASMLSCGNQLRINFGSLSRASDLERLFFTKLRVLGLHVKMEHRSMED